MAKPQAIYFSSESRHPADVLRAWCDAQGLAIAEVASVDELMVRTLRARPRLVFFDALGATSAGLDACRRLKRDSYTGVIPAVVLACDALDGLVRAFGAGADEVLRAEPDGELPELTVRLDALLRRVDRDVHVHPSTFLAGAPAIEAEIARRLAAEELFAVCYADLDHFKEYNDRYSYYEGDRVIRILAKILHDVAKGLCPEDSFVGHIGGDDFIFIVPLRHAAEISQEILDIFDALVPCQYSEQDRRAGYFFGKDRRGQLHRVPLMTLSIGIVTNERRRFTHPAQVSELASEMKSYAKTLAGSVYVVDRRQDAALVVPASAER